MKLLVCGFRIKLLSLYELVVEVNVIPLALIQLPCVHLIPRVESITDESLESNCSIIENIPPKGVGFSDFIATFAMSC